MKKWGVFSLLIIGTAQANSPDADAQAAVAVELAKLRMKPVVNQPLTPAAPEVRASRPFAKRSATMWAGS